MNRSQKAVGAAALAAAVLGAVVSAAGGPTVELGLRGDPTLSVTRSHGLVYSDAPPVGSAEAAATGDTTAPYALDQTFLLHSRPGSTHKIYLDFTGHTTSGTSWNTDYNNGYDITSVPFNIDGKAGFSAAEDAVIQRAYLQVREDYAPFDVDVTTQDPGVEALRKTSDTDNAYGVRVVVSDTEYFHPGVGGVAYLNTFTDSRDTPAFVFTRSSTSSKFIGEASSHEVGHTLGLHHEGTTSGVTYFSGQGSWAPILGVSYYKPRTQFSRGDYPGANNTEDQLAVITNNGLGYVADDVSGGTDTVATLPAGTRRYGVIGQTGDVDAYKFSLGSSHTVRIRAFNNAGPVDANLNLRGVLKTSTGVVKFTSSPSDSLGFDVTVTLPPGLYFLYLTGVGEGSSTAGGYSSYGSLGFYGTQLDWA